MWENSYTVAFLSQPIPCPTHVLSALESWGPSLVHLCFLGSLHGDMELHGLQVPLA